MYVRGCAMCESFVSACVCAPCLSTRRVGIARSLCVPRVLDVCVCVCARYHYIIGFRLGWGLDGGIG